MLVRSAVFASIGIGAFLALHPAGNCQSKPVADVERLAKSIEAGSLSSEEMSRFAPSCSDSCRAALTYARFVKDRPGAALKAFSDFSDETDLYFFEKENEGWAEVGRVTLSAHYEQQPRISFPSLILPGEQEIMVEDQITDWGTGLQQTNLTIYKFLHGRLEIVLDTPERVSYNEPISTMRFAEIEQRSEFRILPSQPSEGTAANHLIEKRTVTQRISSTQSSSTKGPRQHVTRWRNWIWDDKAKRFRDYETWEEKSQTSKVDLGGRRK